MNWISGNQLPISVADSLDADANICIKQKLASHLLIAAKSKILADRLTCFGPRLTYIE